MLDMGFAVEMGQIMEFVPPERQTMLFSATVPIGIRGLIYHYMAEPIDSYQGWRVGLPPQWYPTHSNAYYIGVTGGSFVEVCCMGMPSTISHLPDSWPSCTDTTLPNRCRRPCFIF